MNMLGKRLLANLSGDDDVPAKRHKLSGNVRSVLYNEAVLSQPSAPIIDLTGDDGKPQLSGLVTVLDEEPGISMDARKTVANLATPSWSSIQIVDLTTDDIDLDKLPTLTTPPTYDLTKKASGRDKSRLEMMEDDAIEVNDKMESISGMKHDVSNENTPHNELTQPYDRPDTHDKLAPDKGAIYDLAREHSKLQPERVSDLINKHDESRHEGILAYDTCFGLVCPLIGLTKTTYLIQ
jgi:hypothetical protein